MTIKKNNADTGVLMLMGTQCTYCAPMMVLLTELMKSGKISKLEIINIEQNPELAAELGVRSVPWLQIGPFELTGARTRDELILWLQRASGGEGMTEYLQEVLAEGKIDLARNLIDKMPEALENVIDLMADPDAKINVRLGVGVMIEELADSELFRQFVPRLEAYLVDADPRIRGDACHYLSLTKDKAHIEVIKKLLDDESAEVREIAEESLQDIESIRS